MAKKTAESFARAVDEPVLANLGFVDDMAPAAALRQAQVEMWREKEWQAPFYWAAFVIQGDWQ